MLGSDCMPKIYIDILIIVNFAICFASIDIACSVLKIKASIKRQLLGAALSSASSVTIVISNLLAVIFIKLVFLVFSALIVFKTKSIFRLTKYSFVLLYINLVMISAIYLLWYFSKSKRIFIINYTIYFDVSLLTLCFSIVLSYTVITLVDRVLNIQKIKNELYFLELKIQNEYFKLRCLVDTGNLLCDAINGKSVVVCKSIIMKEKFIVDEEVPFGFRLIPYKTTDGMSVMYATTPSEAILVSMSGERKSLDISIGIADDDCEELAIINPRLIV